MSIHHPGTYVAHNNVDMTDVPWAVTTHLLSINHQQLLRATQHPFLAHAANGTLPKSVIAQWLANDREYLKGYISANSTLLQLLRQQNHTPTAGAKPDIETRLAAWCHAGVQNGEREMQLFTEVAEIYNMDLPNSPLHDSQKSEGLRQYESTFAKVAAQQPNTFIPWLEGAILLWATEKCYYEAWSWARRQDAQASPRNFDNDQDGGAMRREFIPNWSNRDFLMFVEQLERIVNEGVSDAVGRHDELWRDVKKRTDAIWQAVLDAEEAFWPDVAGTQNSSLREVRVDGVRGSTDGTTLNSTSFDEVLEEKTGDIDINQVKWNGHIPQV